MKISHILPAFLLLASFANAQEQLDQLFPSDPAVAAEFGNAVAIVGDLAIVGNSKWSGNGLTAAGAAYIYRRTAGTWALEAQLFAPIQEDMDHFGTSVAIYNDVAVVGAPDFPYSGFSGTGRAWVYRLNAGTWTSEQELVPNNATWDDTCGSQIAISGTTIAVSNSSADSISVYDYAAGSWTETGMVTSPSTSSAFGTGFVLKGTTMVVGSAGETVNGFLNAGAVHVFERSGNSWLDVATLTDPIPNDEDYFGLSVGFDQDVIVAGVPWDNFDFFLKSGKAHVFRKVQGTWQHEARLEPSRPSTGSEFGRIVAVSGDRILTSSYADHVAGSQNGGASYAFRWDGAQWLGGAPFYPADSASLPGFGRAAALDGNTAIVGNLQHALGYYFVGSAIVWDLSAGFRLEVNPTMPESDNFSQWSLRGGAANSPAWLAYSLHGLGNVFVAQLNVELGIANPNQAGPNITLNALGEGVWNLYLPPQALFRTVWWQAVQMGNASNVLATYVR